MSPLELKPGEVMLFKNDKGDNERRPDYRGELKTPEGKQYRYSLWIREGKNQKFMSGEIQDLESTGNPEPQPTKVVDDDIPF